MYRFWGGLGVLTAVLLGLAGCTTTDSHLKKPPKSPEEYTVPPENDPRYDRPVEYPKEVLDRDPLLQKAKGKDTPGMINSPRSPGASGRIGSGF